MAGGLTSLLKPRFLYRLRQTHSFGFGKFDGRDLIGLVSWCSTPPQGMKNPFLHRFTLLEVLHKANSMIYERAAQQDKHLVLGWELCNLFWTLPQFEQEQAPYQNWSEGLLVGKLHGWSTFLRRNNERMRNRGYMLADAVGVEICLRH